MGRGAVRHRTGAVRRSRSAYGQATVELVCGLCVVALLLGVALQCGVLMVAQLAVTHAAREGARTAAVHPESWAAAAHDGAGHATRWPVAELRVAATLEADDVVRVRVAKTVAIVLPGSHVTLASVEVEGEAAMRLERGEAPL